MSTSTLSLALARGCSRPISKIAHGLIADIRMSALPSICPLEKPSQAHHTSLMFLPYFVRGNADKGFSLKVMLGVALIVSRIKKCTDCLML